MVTNLAFSICLTDLLAKPVSVFHSWEAGLYMPHQLWPLQWYLYPFLPH